MGIETDTLLLKNDTLYDSQAVAEKWDAERPEWFLVDVENYRPRLLSHDPP